MRKKDNIYCRKDGRYEGRYPIGISETGRKIYRSVYGNTRKEVKEKLAEAKAKVPEFKKDMSFKDAAKSWLEGQSGARASTFSTYTAIVNNGLIPLIGEVSINKIDTKLKQDLIQKLHEESFQETTIRTYINILDRIIGANVQSNKLEYGDEKSETEKNTEIMADKHFEMFKNEIQKEITPIKLGFGLICFAGLKVGEACTITWNDIDLEERLINVRRTVERVKTTNGESKATRLATMDIEPRIVPIAEPLYKMLTQLKPAAKSRYYLFSGNEKLKESRTLQYQTKKLLEEMGLPNYSPTVMRNTFAVNALKAGVSPKAVAQILGVKIGMINKLYDFIEINLKEEIQKIK